MFIDKVCYIFNSGDKHYECKCETCGESPALQLEADCHGDSMCFCEKHWKEWFNNELLPAFQIPLSDNYIELPEKDGVKIYKYK